VASNNNNNSHSSHNNHSTVDTTVPSQPTQMQTPSPSVRPPKGNNTNTNTAPAPAPANEVVLPAISPSRARPGAKTRHAPSHGHASGHASGHAPSDTDTILAQASSAEKDATIADLRATVELLNNKVNTLERLVKLKDAKIQALAGKLAK
jgi:hypothetical protein